MKIVFLTLGSRGDVQPYAALAKELIRSGHEALVCTGASFRQFVLEHGVRFHEASADLMAVLESGEGKEIFHGGQFHLFKMLKYAREVITPAYRKSMDDFLEASEGADLIIYHPKALGAADIAEFLKIPCISMPPVPVVYPIREFPNLAVAAGKNFGPYLNRLTYKASSLAEATYMKEINDFRKKSLRLPGRKAGERFLRIEGKEIPIIYPISPYLFREVQSWKDRVYLSGFFFMDIGASLSEELERFLEKGEKPVVVSFSSMPLKDPGLFQKKLVQALKETGNRAVILTGTSGMAFQNDDQIFALEKAPHRLIFSRAKGIVHHGGAGTMSEALLSGAPQLIIPFSVDQPFWADRLHSSGYALHPLKEKNLAVRDLVKAFHDMGLEKYVKNALEIKEIIQSENGLVNAARYAELIYEARNKK